MQTYAAGRGTARATSRSRPQRSDAERGLVLIWASTTMLVVGGVIMAATVNLRSLDEVTRADFSAQGQAQEVAEAGLVDAYAWFRRQQVQPVATFAPKLDLAANPPLNETEDPTQGLVRTFEITPGVWGRYTVRLGRAPEVFNDKNRNGYFDGGDTFTDTNGDGEWSPGTGTRDVTRERGLAGTGTVWLLWSEGQ